MRLLHQRDEIDQVLRWSQLFSLCIESDCSLLPGEFHLLYRNGQLSLCRAGDGEGVAVQARNLNTRRRGKFALAQACGDTAGGLRSILDATAGLGSDLLALYERGYKLVGLERNAVIYALLDSYLIARNLTQVELLLTDACEFLADLEPAGYDVIYLDPMFPARGKKALPGKSMQYLRELLADEVTDPLELLELARRAAGDRVVLKRRLRDPLLAEPDWQVKGSSVRYDVYRPLR